MLGPARRALSGAVALSLLLGACIGGGEPDEPEVAGSAEPGTAPTSDDGSSPSVSPLFESDERVLNVAIREASTLDPMRIQDPGSVLIVRQLFEGLTRWDPVEERVRPAIAESWAVDGSGRRYTFKLRPGTTFHDGTPVTAGDFAFAFDRIAAKENASDVAYTLEEIEGFDQVNGFGDAKHLSGVRAVDDLTLVITLSQPNRDFPAVLTHPSLVPVPRAATSDLDDFLSFPTGNGPFRIARRWQVGDEVVLRAYAGYVDTPELDGIRFLPYPDAAASWLQFLDGTLDVVEVPAGQIDAAAQAYGERGYVPLLAGSYYGLNLDSAAMRNIDKRRAISLAIDREAIASTIYKGTLQPARGIVPRGMPGFNEDLCVDICSRDISRARRLVNGLPRSVRSVVLEYSRFAGEPHARVAKAIKQDLESVGLATTIRSYPFEAYLRRLRDQKPAAFRLGWIAEYPVPDAFLGDLFESDSPDNHSGFADPRVDSILARARSQPSEGKRAQLYLKAERAILRRLPVVPIGSFVTHWAAQPTVEDIGFDPMGGFDAVGVRVAQE